MNRRFLLTVITAVFSSFFIAAVLYAGTKVQDTFPMKSDIYEKHTYDPATLTHKKHVDDYGAKCGDCHHDKEGKPLTNLKYGDDVQKCSECHNKPGRKPKGEKLSDQERRMYQAEALHDNCKDCHKKFNKKVKKETGKKGTAPVSCKSCHPGGKLK